MTTPSETRRAILRTAEFLRYIGHVTEEYEGIPQQPLPGRLRGIALRLLRHYPLTDAELDELGREEMEKRT